MPNKAQRNLQALGGAGPTRNALEEARKNEQQVQSTPDIPLAQPEGAAEREQKAKFASPEAAATAIAASFILGPAAGIGLGLAQGFMMKKEKQNELDRVAAINDTLSGVEKQGDAFWNGIDTSGYSEEDVAQAEANRTQYEMGSEFMRIDPEKGVGMMNEALAKQAALEQKNEEQRIARDVEDKAARRALGKENFDRYQVIQDDLRRESGDFLAQKDAYGRIIASAEDPSGAGDIALIFNFMKVLDPISTVREGEFATAQNSAGVDDTVRALYNKLLSGERLTPEQRADFVNRSGRIFNSAVGTQIERNTKARELARTAGMDEEYVSQLGFKAEPVELAARITVDPEVAGAAQDEFTVHNSSGVAKLAAILGKEAVDFVVEVFREARGEDLVERDGKYFIRDKEGNIIKEVDPPQDMKEALQETKSGKGPYQGIFGLGQTQIREETLEQQQNSTPEAQNMSFNPGDSIPFVPGGNRERAETPEPFYFYLDAGEDVPGSALTADGMRAVSRFIEANPKRPTND